MKKGLAVALITGAICVWAVGASAQTPNAGTVAYLAFSPTDTTNINFTNVGAGTINLFVIYARPAGMDFKGGEIDVTWDPPGDGAGCFDWTASFYKTSTTCTYLNRGSIVPIETANEPGHYHVAWASNSSGTGCTIGAGVQLVFDISTCVDATGCFHLNSALILGGPQNLIDVCQIGNANATVLGGGTHCVPLPVQPATWGKIKNFYR